MKTRELIEKLQALDQEAEVTVKVHTSTTRYPQSNSGISIVQPWHLGVGIHVWLEDGQYVGKRKSS